MPTGYTAKLCEQEVPFEEFVMTCARAMGACVMMRDEPLDAPIPESFSESDYHTEQLEQSRAKLKALLEMNDLEVAVFGNEQKVAAITYAEKSLAKAQAQNKRLREMLAKVDAWEPPTQDHKGLKKFMQEQLTISMDNESYDVEALQKAKDKTPQQFHDEAVESARWSVGYHVKEKAADAQRNQGRTDWVQQLRASLKGESK
jgi:hypothetical protein